VELEEFPPLSSTSTRRPAGVRPAAGRTAHPRRRKQLSWLERIVFGGVVAVIAVVAWAALARALAPQKNTLQSQFDVLIVLGTPADSDGNPTPMEQAFVSEAVREYERGVAPRIIFTGGAAHNQFVEAQVMARTAEAQGIPAAAILKEEQARNTIENACDSLRIMRSHGWDSAEIVTNQNHIPRAAMIFSRLPVKYRMHAAALPGPEPNWLGADSTAMEILKTVHYLVWSRPMEPCEAQ
jgi:uncharacterized SAM-binding protein YcdF (DUF218 family)